MPANAIFVSPTGNDSGAGSLTDPLQTVGAALAKAAAGQTVVLRAGTYHEQVTITKAGVTIEPYPFESVWFDGTTPVTGWTQSGSTWVHSGWTAHFDNTAYFASGQVPPAGWQMVGPQNPMASWPDGVWIDGVEQTQVATAANVTAGTFYVDYTADQLVVGSNPAGHAVRASDLAQAFNIQSANVVLQGFGVERYATSLPLLGTIRATAGTTTLRDLVVTDNASQGISFHGSNNLVDHVTASGNGMVGIAGNDADGLTVQNSLISANNAQLFNAAPSAAGIKITKSRGLTFVNDSFLNNQADGLWFDQADVGFTIANNTFAGNDDQSIALELADSGIVANNVISGGSQALYLFDTGDVQVYNNTFTNTPVATVMLSQDDRRQNNAYWYGLEGDPRYPMGDPTDPWLTRNLTIANNVFYRSTAGGWFQVYALDKKTNIPADSMNIVINGNDFSAHDVTAQPVAVGWGGSDNVSLTRYATIASFDAAKNPSWNNLQDNLSPGAAASTNSVAVPLPSSVSAAIGVPAGTVHVGSF